MKKSRPTTNSGVTFPNIIEQALYDEFSTWEKTDAILSRLITVAEEEQDIENEIEYEDEIEEEVSELDRLLGKLASVADSIFG